MLVVFLVAHDYTRIVANHAYEQGVTTDSLVQLA